MIKIARILILYILLLSGFMLFSGCTGASDLPKTSMQQKKISVYTSFYTMYDFAKKIGGDKVDLHNLVYAGTEPHDWEPSPRDVVNIEKADVLIYNGAGMEPWIFKVLKAVKNPKLITVETAKGLQLLKNTVQNRNLEYDPHVWLDPMLAKRQTEAVKNALAAADPVNKNYYEANYIYYSGKFDELDREYKDAVSKFSKRDVVVAHQAFGYLCEAYGLRQIAIEGLNADSEPTPARMAEIAKFSKEKNVRVIFFEELISPKVAQAIAREVGAETDMLNPLEGIKEDDIRAGREYFSIMRDNLKALKRALE